MTAYHRTGQATALLCILIGLGLLGVVFYYAYGMLTNPVPGLILPKPHPGGSVSGGPNSVIDFGQIGIAAVQFFLKLAVLLVATIVASQMMSRGVHLFHVASGQTKTVEDVSPLDSGSKPALSLSDTSAEPIRPDDTPVSTAKARQ